MLSPVSMACVKGASRGNVSFRFGHANGDFIDALGHGYKEQLPLTNERIGGQIEYENN